MRATLLLVFTCFLTACGGGGGDSPADPRAPSRSATDEDVYANTQAAMNVCTQARTVFEQCGGDFWDADKKICTTTQPADERVYIQMIQTLADKNEPCAQYGLGTLYRTGFPELGLDPNEAQAQIWLQKAAAQGHTLSQQELETTN